MKKDIRGMQKLLLFIIGVLSMVLLVVLVMKVHQLHQEKLQKEEWEVRHVEVQAEVDDFRMKIEELSADSEALQAFLEENIAAQQDTEFENMEDNTDTASESQEAVVVEQPEASDQSEQANQPEASAQDPSAQEQAPGEGEESLYDQGDAIIIDIPEKALPQQPAGQGKDESVSGNGDGTMPEDETVSGNGDGAMPEDETVSGNGDGVMPADETVSGNGDGLGPDGETVSGNGTSRSGADGSAGYTISGNAIVNGEVIPFVFNESDLTLEARRSIRSSFVETEQVNGEDKFIISNSNYDFSGLKIACLGDSITEGSNLDKMENYQQYSYPSVLKNILHAKEVYNLGIGGSSYGRYWDQAFVDRYREIPADTDIILVMGGTNDGFAASQKELGSLSEKKTKTFYGDVDELMRGLRENYPEAKIIFATPLPNVLHDYLRNQRDYLLPQSVFAKAVKELAAQYDIDVIDLYNSNLLDTHDAQIISTYMPDGVHGNVAGYQILAEHMASQVIRIMEKDTAFHATVSGNGTAEMESSVSENSVSGNGVPEEAETLESVSGNGSGAAQSPLMQDGKWIEEEITTEEEREQEAKKAAEGNQKVAEDVMLVEPESAASAQNASAAEQGDAGTDAGSGNADVTEEPVKNYEYSGEAIVIQ